MSEEKDKMYYDLEEILCDVVGYETSAGEMGLSVDEALKKIMKLFGYWEETHDK